MNNLQRYQDHVNNVRCHEKKRLGYPVVGSLINHDEPLGILPGSISDVYLNNIGNPYDIPTSFHHHSKLFEQEVIALCARYLNLPEDTRGYITTGGTEGNFAGLWWAREYCSAIGKNNTMPRLFASDQAHYSVKKIADQLHLKFETVPSTMRGGIDLKAFEMLLLAHQKNHPDEAVMVLATAGTTQKGGIDDVLGMRCLLDNIIVKNGGIARLHLDAALLGLALPVLKPKTHTSILRAVDSISISAHKLLASRAIISGLILSRHSYLEDVFSKKTTKVSMIGDIHDITVSGSRSGFQAIALHHRLVELGFCHTGEKLKNQIRQNIALSQYFYERLTQIVDSSDVLRGDNQFTVTFPRPANADQLILEYSLMPLDNNKLGVCVLAHVTKALLDEFLCDYQNAMQIMKNA